MLFFLSYPVSAKDSDWIGIYTFNEESWDETRERTSYWFRLEVKESDGKLVGIYSDGINGTAARRFQFTVRTEDKKARFFFERSLPRVEGLEERCAESEFTGGELLFEFEESIVDGEPVIYTHWQKMNLAVRTETGGAYGRKSVFFRKVYLKKHDLEFMER